MHQRPETCQNITRRADGNVDHCVKSLEREHIGLIETSGIDFNITYNTEFDFGFYSVTVQA